MMPRFLGHNHGAKAAEKIVLACKKLGVQYVTLYTFSTENWQRPPEEIDNLLKLLRSYLQNNIQRLIDEKIKIQFIGDLTRLPTDIQDMTQNAVKLSQDGTLTLTIALSYGARDEIRAAALAFMRDALHNPQLATAAQFDCYLSTHGIPDPDLLIRTGGEHRISNFLLWQLAYTELYFCDKLWPDFNEEDLQVAFAAYNERERRYGC